MNHTNNFFLVSILLVISISICLGGSAQSRDSLGLKPSELSTFYLNLSLKHGSENPKLGKEYALQAFELAEELNQTFLAAEASKEIGMFYFFENKNELAKKFFDKAIVRYTVLDSIQKMAYCHKWNGNAMLEAHKYNDAMRHYASSKEAYENLNIKDQEAGAYMNFGQVYFMKEEYDKSLENYETALHLIREVDESENTVQLYNNLGMVHNNLKRYEEANDYYTRALNMVEKYNFQNGRSSVLNNIAIMKTELGEFDQALNVFNEIISISEKSNDKAGLSFAYSNIGDVKEKELKFKSALRYYEKSLVLAHELELTRLKRNLYGKMAAIFSTQLKFDSAYYYQKLQFQTSSELNKKTNNEELNEIQSLMEFERKDKEIELLHKEQRIQSLTRYRLIAIIFALSIISILLFLFFRTKTIKNRIIHLQEQNLIKAQLDQNKIEQLRLKDEVRYKTVQLTNHALNIKQKNEILKQIQSELSISDKSEDIENSNVLQLITNNLHVEKDWDRFKKYFEQVNPDFYDKLKKNATDLSPAELRLCALIRLNYSPKESSSILYLSPHTIKSTRYRIRKKIQLESGEKLDEFIRAL